MVGECDNGAILPCFVWWQAREQARKMGTLNEGKNDSIIMDPQEYREVVRAVTTGNSRRMSQGELVPCPLFYRGIDLRRCHLEVCYTLLHPPEL